MTNHQRDFLCELRDLCEKFGVYAEEPFILYVDGKYIQLEIKKHNNTNILIRTSHTEYNSFLATKGQP